MDASTPITKLMHKINNSKSSNRSLSPIQYHHNNNNKNNANSMNIEETPPHPLPHPQTPTPTPNQDNFPPHNSNSNSHSPFLNVNATLTPSQVHTPQTLSNPNHTLRHALGVVEKLQAQLFTIRSELQDSDDNCSSFKKKHQESQSEISSLRQSVISLQGESTEKSELLLRLKKTHARELEEALDEKLATKRSLEIEKESVKNYETTLKLMEQQLAEKNSETEEQTNKAMDLAHRTQLAASNSLQRENSKHNAFKIKHEAEIIRLFNENTSLKSELEKTTTGE